MNINYDFSLSKCLDDYSILEKIADTNPSLSVNSDFEGSLSEPVISILCSKGRIFEYCFPNLNKGRKVFFNVKENVSFPSNVQYDRSVSIPVNIYKMRSIDILDCLSKDTQGVYLGILGSDIFYESAQQDDFVVCKRFKSNNIGFCFAGKKDDDLCENSKLWKDFLNGETEITIATSYPKILKKVLTRKFGDKLKYEILNVSGCVESTLFLNVDKKANFIFDIVETGRTLRENNLEVYGLNGTNKTVFKSDDLSDLKVECIDYFLIKKNIQTKEEMKSR